MRAGRLIGWLRRVSLDERHIYRTAPSYGGRLPAERRRAGAACSQASRHVTLPREQASRFPRSDR